MPGQTDIKNNLCWVEWHPLHIYNSPIFLVCTLHLQGRVHFNPSWDGTSFFSHSCTSQFSTWGSAPPRSGQQKGSLPLWFLALIWVFSFSLSYWLVKHIKRKSFHSGKLFVCYNGWQQWWTVSVAWTPHCKPSPIRSINLLINVHASLRQLEVSICYN